MNLRALFDEGRRKEIRDALKSGRPIEFRNKPPEIDLTMSQMEEITLMGQSVRKAYGSSRYVSMAAGMGLESALVSIRRQTRMAKAATNAEGNQKPKEVKPEESGKNQ